MQRTLSFLLLLLATSLATPLDGQGRPAKLLPSGGSAGDWFGYDVALSGQRLLVGVPEDYGGLGGGVVYERRDGGWVETARLDAPDAAPGERWGTRVALSGGVAVLGAPQAEAAWVFELDAASWRPAARLRPPSDAGSEFGAELAVGDDRIFVGAPGADVRAQDSGALHVFGRSDGGWSELQMLWPVDGTARDRFGSALSVSGAQLLCGAWGDGDERSYSGSAYVFTNAGGGWRQTAKLVASDGPTSYYFGDALAISESTAVIGAWGDDDQGVVSGSAYVFERRSEGWVQTAKLLASDGEELDFYGWSVALSGETILVGAFRDDDQGESAGAAYVIRRDGSGWREAEKLVAPAGDPYDYFGYALALEGRSAVLGAYLDDDMGREAGAAYVFTIPERGHGAPRQAPLFLRLSSAGPAPSWLVLPLPGTRPGR